MKVTFCGPFAMSLFKEGEDLRAMKSAQKLKERGSVVEFLSTYSTKLTATISIFQIHKASYLSFSFCRENNHKFWHFSWEEGEADVGKR
jgi:hypothetical protein